MNQNLHRISGARAAMQNAAASGPCGIGKCGKPSVGYIEGTSFRPVGVCEDHAVGALERGYAVLLGEMGKR